MSTEIIETNSEDLAAFKGAVVAGCEFLWPEGLSVLRRRNEVNPNNELITVATALLRMQTRSGQYQIHAGNTPPTQPTPPLTPVDPLAELARDVFARQARDATPRPTVDELLDLYRPQERGLAATPPAGVQHMTDLELAAARRFFYGDAATTLPNRARDLANTRNETNPVMRPEFETVWVPIAVVGSTLIEIGATGLAVIGGGNREGVPHAIIRKQNSERNTIRRVHFAWRALGVNPADTDELPWVQTPATHGIIHGILCQLWHAVEGGEMADVQADGGEALGERAGRTEQETEQETVAYRHLIQAEWIAANGGAGDTLNAVPGHAIAGAGAAANVQAGEPQQGQP